MTDIEKYQRDFKKYRSECWNAQKQYHDKHNLRGVISSEDHPEYFVFDDIWKKKRAELDAPILQNSKYKIGDILTFTGYDFNDKPINSTGRVYELKTCEMGTGRVMYSFVNIYPYDSPRFRQAFFYEHGITGKVEIKHTCEIVHNKKSRFDIYIGRPSKWGNPYTHIQDGKTMARFIVNDREEAIECYRNWITQGDGKHLLHELNELKGKTLGCWCKPKYCHGDILKELVEQYCL